jgi:predicted alpha/beta-fold hydrolase
MRFLTALMVFLLSTFSAVRAAEEFRPSWWCRGGHAQTVCGSVFRRVPEVTYRRERLELPDGDFVDLDWADGGTGMPVVVIFHGLASSSESPYIKTLIAEFREKKWSAVVMNARGQSGEPSRLKGTHHAGRSEDVGYTVRHVIKTRRPPAVYLACYSIGGNILLKWLGETGAAVPPDVKMAAAISVPYDLQKTAEHLDRGFSREVYTRLMLDVLIPLALEKETRFPGSLNRPAVEKAKTFQIYDREVTARLNGFKNEIEYWEHAGAKKYLSGIQIPALLVHAANDPFLPGAFLPHEAIRQNLKLQLILTPDGGHLGFKSGFWPWQDSRWLDKTIAAAFAENFSSGA